MRSARSSAGVRGTVRGRDSIGYSGLLAALPDNAASFREVRAEGRIMSHGGSNRLAIPAFPAKNYSVRA